MIEEKLTIIHMRQLTKIRFSSYKRFAGSEEIELKPVTVLVGKNSSGKSSITKLFPLFRNSLSEFATRNVFDYSNEPISLGVNFSDLVHNGDFVELGLGVSLSDDLSIDMEFIANGEVDFVVRKYTLNSKNDVRTLNWDKTKQLYVCEQNKKEYFVDFRGFVHVGLFKELGIDTNVSQRVSYFGPLREMPNRIIYPVVEPNDSKGKNMYSVFVRDEELQHRVSLWLKSNFEGCTIIAKPASDKGSYQIVLNKPDQGEHQVNIANEGMGVIQMFPVIVRCMQKVENSIVVIEQPELHLHPAAHASLAKLFAQTSKVNGHTYVIETHSENILLGLREAVVDKNVDFYSDDVVIYFVDEDEMGSYLKRITISDNGELSDWPNGVFNESYELLKSIMQKASEK
jgi:predicted ATPase